MISYTIINIDVGHGLATGRGRGNSEVVDVAPLHAQYILLQV